MLATIVHIHKRISASKELVESLAREHWPRIDKKHINRRVLVNRVFMYAAQTCLNFFSSHSVFCPTQHVLSPLAPCSLRAHPIRKTAAHPLSKPTRCPRPHSTGIGSVMSTRRCFNRKIFCLAVKMNGAFLKKAKR